jgi:WD40 repeat protein
MYLWDLDGTLLKRQLNPARGRVYQAAFTPDGQWLAAASASGRTTIWSPTLDVSFELTTPQGSSIGGVAFSRDGQWLATIGSEALGSSVRPKTLLWSVSCFETQRCEPILEFENPPGANEKPVFSPDGKRLTISNGDLHSIIVFDLEKKTSTRLAPHGTYTVLQVFSPDGETLATVGLDTAIRLWDTSTWEFRELRGHQNFVQAVAFSRDGQSLVSGGYDQSIRIWDIASGEYRTLTAPDRLLHRVYYSPDNERVISISDSGVIRVWLDNLPRQEDAFWAWLAKTPTPK